MSVSIESEMRYRLKIGDTITHTRCLGLIEEHIFTGWDGHWICGRATKCTLRLSPGIARKTNDIAPGNITHINREPVDLPANLRRT